MAERVSLRLTGEQSADLLCEELKIRMRDWFETHQDMRIRSGVELGETVWALAMAALEHDDSPIITVGQIRRMAQDVVEAAVKECAVERQVAHG